MKQEVIMLTRKNIKRIEAIDDFADYLISNLKKEIIWNGILHILLANIRIFSYKFIIDFHDLTLI